VLEINGLDEMQSRVSEPVHPPYDNNVALTRVVQQPHIDLQAVFLLIATDTRIGQQL
jgi:hypothetical protein